MIRVTVFLVFINRCFCELKVQHFVQSTVQHLLKNPHIERILFFCNSNEIKDKKDFSDCKAYSQIRDVFFSKIGIKIPDLKSLSHDTLFSIDLTNSSDYLINCRLVCPAML